MSEYQYYEFRAVDRPLAPQQQAELRSRSSRATITASSFINEYHWGNLKGDPLDWMQRYFDAHVYSAHWGTCNFMLRLPISALDKAVPDPFTLQSQCGAQSGFSDAFGVTATADHWILYWGFNDDSGEFERFWSHEDGPGWMSSLLPLRDELFRGDTRPLYLGWLARLCNEELGDDDIEPPMPAGLGALTPAQTALTEFLQIDPDWLAAAAGASSVLPDHDTIDPDLDDWIASQTLETMQTTTRLLLEGRSQEAERALRQRYLAWQRERSSNPKASSRRTVAEIDAGRERARGQRLELERKRLAAEEAKRHAVRKQQLERLAANSDRVWAGIDQTLQRGSGHAYDEALQAVKDLAEAMAQAGREAEFQAGPVKLLAVHGKQTWRLDEATGHGTNQDRINLMAQQIQSHFIGAWRILEMDAWDADYFDVEAPAYIAIREDLSGEFQFGLVQGDLDGRVEKVEGDPRFDFSWTGFDESDPVNGRGWLRVNDKNAEGQLFIHRGDESGFKAVRQ